RAATPLLCPPSLPTRRSSDLPADVPPHLGHDPLQPFHAVPKVMPLGKVTVVPEPGRHEKLRCRDGEPATGAVAGGADGQQPLPSDRKSTRLNSSHVKISYAVF